MVAEHHPALVTVLCIRGEPIIPELLALLELLPAVVVSAKHESIRPEDCWE
jgi:hypothetical protein